MRILAVGNRMPSWVSQGTEAYTRRLPRELPLEVVEVAPGSRAGKAPPERALAQEAKRLRGLLSPRDHVIALDVAGRRVDTEGLAAWLTRRQQAGGDLVFLIGGPDGLAPDLSKVIDERLSLSPLTLPHGLARLVLAEQLYRAWSVNAGHPYHRAGSPGA